MLSGGIPRGAGVALCYCGCTGPWPRRISREKQSHEPSAILLHHLLGLAVVFLADNSSWHGCSKTCIFPSLPQALHVLFLPKPRDSALPMLGQAYRCQPALITSTTKPGRRKRLPFPSVDIQVQKIGLRSSSKRPPAYPCMSTERCLLMEQPR